MTLHYRKTINAGIPLTLLAVCLVAQSAWNVANADDYHYNNLLIGNRAAGLGGAYTAIADDPSGLYYNPAGIVYAVGSNISGSMNAYHTANTTYKNALGSNTDWERKSSALLPSFFGVFQPFGNAKVGFSYAVTDAIQEDQDQTFTNITQTAQQIDAYTINFNNQMATYNIGPSLAFRYSDALSFGATLYLHNRSQERIFHNLIAFNPVDGGDYLESSQYLALDETGVLPKIGVMWSPYDKLSLGATLSKTYITSSKLDIQTTEKVQGSSTVQLNKTSIDDKIDFPLQLALGAAYFFNQELLASGDLTYYSATSDNILGTRQSIMNFALGMEYYLDSHIALRGGVFSNYANTPKLRSTNVTSTQAEHIDFYGVSFSISRFTRNSALSLGLVHSQGSGQAQLFAARSDNTAAIQDVNASTFTLFLSASYSY
jgi:long-subunit fatty acid transport protein